MFQNKYCLTACPKNGTPHNPVHAQTQNTIVAIVDVQPGQGGWLSQQCGANEWRHLRLSTVQNVVVDDIGNVEIETKNTFYRLAKIGA